MGLNSLVLSSSSERRGQCRKLTLGLICNLAGIVLAFFFGFPHPEDVRERRAKHLLLSRAGLALLFIGFVLQLGAIWVATGPQ